MNRNNVNIIFFWVLPIWRSCTYEKLLLQYYVNSHYLDIVCVIGLKQFWETPTEPFPKFFIYLF